MSSYTTLRLNKFLARVVERTTGIDFVSGKRKICRECAFEAPCMIGGAVNLKTPVKVGAFTTIDGACGEGRIANVSIGRYCSIAKNVNIGLPQHPTKWLSVSLRQYFGSTPILVEMREGIWCLQLQFTRYEIDH